MPDLDIRLLDSAPAMEGIEDLQAKIWPGSAVEIVPTHVLLAAVHNGGLVLGAYQVERMVGMLFGFPGVVQTSQGMKTKHCSHMLGVLPGFRDSGLGFALKTRQREFVLAQGLDLVTWTYDPLLSRNAWLNIHRLGAVCNTYLRAEYGAMRDSLNAGLESDRFQVDWCLSSPRVLDHMQSAVPVKVLSLADLIHSPVKLIAAREGLRPHQQPISLDVPEILVEIPPDFQELRTRDLPLAREWRAFTRDLFEQVFAKGMVVSDFLFENGRSYYLLSIKPGVIMVKHNNLSQTRHKKIT